MSTLHGVITEPMSNGLHFVRRGRMQPGQRIAILGAGQIGLSMLFWAKRLGAGRVVVSEPVASRRRFAVELGAHAALDPTAEADLKDAVKTALDGRPDVVLEASGIPRVMDDAIHMVRPRGGVVVLAGITLDELSIRPVALCLKETDLVFPLGTFPDEVAEVLRTMEQGELPAERFVSRRIRHEDVPQAIRELGKRTDDIKVVVDYTEGSA